MFRNRGRFNFETGFLPYWNTLCLCLGLSFIFGFAEPFIGYRAIGFLFLFVVILVGALASGRVVLFAAFGSALCWDFFFIPPRFTFLIRSREDQILCATYFVIAVIAGYRSRKSVGRTSQEARPESRDAQTEIARPTTTVLNRDVVSPYDIFGPILKRLGEALTVQPFTLNVEAGVGFVTVDRLKFESCVVPLIETLAPRPDLKSRVTVTVSKIANDVSFQFESGVAISPTSKVIKQTEEVIHQLSGKTVFGQNDRGGTIVTLNLPAQTKRPNSTSRFDL